MTDDLAAALAGIRGLIAARDDLTARMDWSAVDVSEFNAAQDKLAARVPALLAAVEAALKLADEWEQEGVDPGWQLTNEDAAAGLAGREHSSALQGAITAVLTRAGVPRT